MALSSEQNRVLREALRTASRLGASPRERKALVLAGLVESNLQHERYSRVGSGDRDSVGFLQQRPSQGWGAPGESVATDTRQFLEAAKRANKGRGSAGQLAQAVQRSAFPDRYDERSGQAEGLLRRAGGGVSRSSGGGGSAQPQVTPAPEVGVADLAGLMGALQQPERPRSAGLASPAFAAGPTLAAGAQSVQSSGGGRERPGDALAAALAGVSALGGVDLPARQDTAGEAPETSRGAGGTGKPGGKFAGTQGLIEPLSRLVQDEFGLQTTSGKRGTRNTASGNVSDHFIGKRNATARDWSGTPEQMNRASRALARRLGIKNYKPGSIVNTTRGGYRYQLIYGTSDHRDHVHLGIEAK